MGSGKINRKPISSRTVLDCGIAVVVTSSIERTSSTERNTKCVPRHRVPATHSSGGGIDGSHVVQVYGRELNPVHLQLLIHLLHRTQLGHSLEGIRPILDQTKNSLLHDGGWIILAVQCVSGHERSE